MNSKLGMMAATIMLGAMSNPIPHYSLLDFEHQPKKAPNIKATESDLFAKHGKSKSKRAKRRSRT